MDGLLPSILWQVFRLIMIGASLFATYAVLARLRRKRSALRRGWHYLTLGPYMWFAVLGSAAFCCLFSYIYVAVGSSRADAADQMQILTYLIVGFGLGALLMAYIALAEEVRWNDHRIERRTLTWQRVSLAWSQVIAAGREGATGYWWVAGADGTKLRFSPYSSGVEDLLALIRDRFDPDEETGTETDAG